MAKFVSLLRFIDKILCNSVKNNYFCAKINLYHGKDFTDNPVRRMVTPG